MAEDDEGDDAFSESMYREHAAAVLRALRGGFVFRNQAGERGVYRVDSAFEAEDICHEAIVVVLRQMRRQRFDLARPVRPYLLKIATNLALRRGRRGRLEVLLAETPGQVEASSDTLLGGERDALVRAFVETLGEPDRSVLVLTAEDGLTQQSAGERLGLSRDQVYRVQGKIRAAAIRFFRLRGYFDGP